MPQNTTATMISLSIRKNKTLLAAAAAGMLILSASPDAEAVTASEAFINMPATELSILPRTTRMGMIDYYSEADSLWKAPNAMEGISQLEEVAPSYLRVRLTPVSTMEVKVLPGRKDSEEIVMTLYTIRSSEDEADDGADTQIRFYDAKMQVLPTEKYFRMPQFKEFFSIPRGSLTSVRELQDMLPFVTVVWHASADSDDLSGHMTFTDAVSQDDRRIIDLFVRPEVKMTWQKGSYRLAKDKKQ